MTKGKNVKLETRADYQTRSRGDDEAGYQIYLILADDGKGGDITRNGAPLKTYEEWLNS